MFNTVTQIFLKGGFTNVTGTPNFLLDIGQYVTQVDWTDSQIGGIQTATFTMRNKYENVTDMVAGDWIIFAALGGVLADAVSVGGDTLIVEDATDDLGNLHLYVGDPILVTDGLNTEIFTVAAISWS